MDKTKQPGIKFDGIILANISFNRKPDIPNNPEIKVNFIAERNIDNKNGIIKITTVLKMEKDISPKMPSKKYQKILLLIVYLNIFLLQVLAN